jgi:hypothetical protein
MATLITQIKVRRDTAANFKNVVLSQGEPGYATDTKKFVIGDGSTTFENLIDYGYFAKDNDVYVSSFRQEFTNMDYRGGGDAKIASIR